MTRIPLEYLRLGYYNKISGEKDDFANNYPLFTNHYLSVTLFDIWGFIIMMNNWKKIIACKVLLALAAFLISSCGDWEHDSGDNKHFTYDLRGIWVTSDKDDRYTGTLEIENNRIRITGFNETQTPVWGGNDKERPFRNFNTGYFLNGYSEVGEVKGHGKIFIQYLGEWQDGIPYYYESTGYPDYANLLYFHFDGRRQLMVRQR
jgi:hypothetical protein